MSRGLARTRPSAPEYISTEVKATPNRAQLHPGPSSLKENPCPPARTHLPLEWKRRAPRAPQTSLFVTGHSVGWRVPWLQKGKPGGRGALGLPSFRGTAPTDSSSTPPQPPSLASATSPSCLATGEAVQFSWHVNSSRLSCVGIVF